MKTYLFLCILIMGSSALANTEESSPENLIVDRIECTGNTNTDCEIIKREVFLIPGENIDEEELRNAKIRLQLSGLFTSVDVTLKKGNVRGHVIVDVSVVEDSPYFVETEISLYRYYESRLSLGIGQKIGHRNIFGTGKILQATINPVGLFSTNNGRFSGGLEYIDPHLFGHKKYFYSAKVDLYRSYFRATENEYSITKDSTLYAINFGRRIFDFSHMSAEVFYRDTNSMHREELTDPFVEKSYYSKGYRLNYGWNSEDDTYFPTEGSKFKTSQVIEESGSRGPLGTIYKKNWSTSEKNIFSLHINDYIDNGYNYHRTGLGVEWARQTRRRQTSKSITDARYFVRPEITYSSLPGFNSTLESGITLDTKSFGIIILTAFVDWAL